MGWYLLIHNLEKINPAWLAQEVEPRLRAWDTARWQALCEQADVRNLSTFLHRFSPHNGLFQWPLPAELRFPLDGKIRQATLPKLAHLLFNFFFIQRPEQSWMLALRLEAESGYIQEQLAAATLAEIEFFFWNYWLALPPEHEARLFRLPSLPDSLRPKLGAKLLYEAHWLGLAGSWRMAAALGLDTIQRDLRPLKPCAFARNWPSKNHPF
jgi:hypothetical protein